MVLCIKRFRSRSHLFLREKGTNMTTYRLAGVRDGIFTLTCLRFTERYKIDTGHKLIDLTHSRRHTGRRREIRKEPKVFCFDVRQRRLYRHDYTARTKNIETKLIYMLERICGRPSPRQNRRPTGNFDDWSGDRRYSYKKSENFLFRLTDPAF